MENVARDDLVALEICYALEIDALVQNRIVGARSAKGGMNVVKL